MKQISLRTALVSAGLVLFALSGWLVQGARAADNATSERVFVTNEAPLHSVPVAVQGTVAVDVGATPIRVDASDSWDLAKAGHLYEFVVTSLTSPNGQLVEVGDAIKQTAGVYGITNYRIMSVQSRADGSSIVYIATK